MKLGKQEYRILNYNQWPVPHRVSESQFRHAGPLMEQMGNIPQLSSIFASYERSIFQSSVSWGWRVFCWQQIVRNCRLVHIIFSKTINLGVLNNKQQLLQFPPYNIQPSISTLQHPPYILQHPPNILQYPYTIQYPPYNIHPTFYNIHSGPYTIHPTISTLQYITTWCIQGQETIINWVNMK